MSKNDAEAEAAIVPGIGTIVNTLAVAAGGCIGLLLRKGMPERFQRVLLTALGSSTMLIGISGVLAGMFRVTENGLLDRADILMLIFSMAIGGVAGELMRIDAAFDRLAERVKNRFSGNEDDGGRFIKGFVSATVLFCVGAMAVVGAIEDGLMNDPSILYAKSVLDGVMSIVFASAYGIGVPLSAAAVLVYQGAITLFSFVLRPLVTDAVMLQMSLVGSAVIMLIGIDMMEIKKINVTNFLPAAFIPLIWEALSRLAGWIGSLVK